MTCQLAELTQPHQFTLQGTNTYILGTGAKRLIIDTAQGHVEWSTLIASTLLSCSSSLSHVLLTHWHGDHTGGVPDLIRQNPSLSSSIYKNSPDKGQQPIYDGQIFEVEGATVRAVHTPGHSHDHMCFILEEENAMFTGDNILGHGTSAIEDLPTFMSTLRKMQAQNCAIGYPAHGSVIRNLPLKLTVELNQKLRREKHVLETLKVFKEQFSKMGLRKRIASVTTDELVLAMYGGVGDEIREMALKPFVEEVCKKLVGDGRMGFEMRGGMRRWFVVDVELESLVQP